MLLYTYNYIAKLSSKHCKQSHNRHTTSHMLLPHTSPPSIYRYYSKYMNSQEPTTAIQIILPIWYANLLRIYPHLYHLTPVSVPQPGGASQGVYYQGSVSTWPRHTRSGTQPMNPACRFLSSLFIYTKWTWWIEISSYSFGAESTISYMHSCHMLTAAHQVALSPTNQQTSYSAVFIGRFVSHCEVYVELKLVCCDLWPHMTFSIITVITAIKSFWFRSGQIRPSLNISCFSFKTLQMSKWIHNNNICPLK